MAAFSLTKNLIVARLCLSLAFLSSYFNTLRADNTSTFFNFRMLEIKSFYTDFKLIDSKSLTKNVIFCIGRHFDKGKLLTNGKTNFHFTKSRENALKICGYFGNVIGYK